MVGLADCEELADCEGLVAALDSASSFFSVRSTPQAALERASKVTAASPTARRAGSDRMSMR